MNSYENTDNSTVVHEGEIIENKAVNNPDQDGNGPLHIAVIQNDQEMLSNLLQQSCIDLNLKNHVGLTPLLLAIHTYSPYSFIMQLVHSGADLNATDNYGMNSLHIALLCCYDEKVLHELIKNGVNINAQDLLKETPLHYAIQRDNMEAVHELIKNGANVNAQDCLKETPLHYAIQRDNMEAVCMLLCYGADVSILNHQNMNPFNVAILNDNIEIPEVLIDYYDDFSDANCEGYTALHFAIDRKHPIVFDLIQAGADVNCITNDNKNPLVMCLGSEEINMELFELMWPKFNYHLLLNAEIPFLHIFMRSVRFSSASKFLKTMYSILNCPVIFELLDDYKKILGCGVFTDVLLLLNQFNIKLCDRLNIISTLLSFGAEIDVLEINKVFMLYGFNEELEMILYCSDHYPDHRYSMFPQCSFIFSTDDLNIIESCKCCLKNILIKNYIPIHYSFFSITSDQKTKLINYYRYYGKFDKHTPAIIDKLNGLPKFPSLVELSRNQARKFIFQNFKITKAYQFHDHVKRLKLPNRIQDIIRFKTPLY